MTEELRFYFEPQEYYAAMREAIASARHRVDLEMYIFASDAVGWAFAEQLARKAQAGVEVRVSYDSVGSQGTSDELWLLLEENGVRLREYNPTFPLPRNLRRRNHRKVLVVDDRIGFLGGFNLMDVNWRDTGVSFEGPELVAELRRQFELSWEHEFSRLRGMARRKIGRRPWQDGGLHLIPSFGLRRLSLIRQAYLTAIVRARERVDITAAYFVPDLGILRALRKAARRGREVRLLTAGLSDVRVAQWASRAVYGKLLRAGVRIFEYQPRILHAKSAVVDGRWFTVGTANLDHLSFFHNLELNLFGTDVDSSQRLSERFEADLRESAELRLEEWRRRSRWARLKEQFCYAFRAWM
ncbi:MAG: phospholipase D-like domain-containing protein [bacterium]